MPDDLFDNEDLDDSTQLFDLEPVTNLPEPSSVNETTLTVSAKIICNKRGKIFQSTDIYRKHEIMCGKLKFSPIRKN